MSGNVEDLKDERVPDALYWSVEDVASWVETIGFSQYKDCFASNCINGRRLSLIDASALPKIGITDFQHIKLIAQGIRALLKLKDPYWNTSISLPSKDEMGQYLERKCTTGEKADSLSYEKFVKDSDEKNLQPPLANMCIIMAHH